MPEKCDTSSEGKIAKSTRLTKQDPKPCIVENEQKCCFWRFPAKGLGVDKGRRITETGKRGNKVVERRRTKFDWQFPWTLFPLFPLFPAVQRLIKFVENVRSRRTIFENKIVKIEENHHYNVPQCKRQISLQDWHLKMEYIVRISELFEDNNFLSTIARALRKIIWRHYLIISEVHKKD